MRKILLRVVGWIFFAWLMFYVYLNFVAFVYIDLMNNIEINDNLAFTIVAILDIVTIIVIYGEKIRRDIRESHLSENNSKQNNKSES